MNADFARNPVTRTVSLVRARRGQMVSQAAVVTG
jgi:hypothetical protein